jgi:hypothetical protein
MINCESTDFMFPMLADVYHPTIEKGAYGSLAKTWLLDRTIAGNFIRAGAKTKEDLIVNIDLTQDSMLIARVRSDIRVSSGRENNAITNILIANIRNSDGSPYYFETAGKRNNAPTIFDVATVQPFVNPFGKIEHHTIILRRAENQGIL